MCVCVYTVITNGFNSCHRSCTIQKSRGQRYPCHFLCQRSWVTCGKDIDQGRLIYVPAIVSTVDFLFLFMSCALFLRSWICVRWNSTARQLRKSGEDYDIIHTFYWPLPHSVRFDSHDVPLIMFQPPCLMAETSMFPSFLMVLFHQHLWKAIEKAGLRNLPHTSHRRNGFGDGRRTAAHQTHHWGLAIHTWSELRPSFRTEGRDFEAGNCPCCFFCLKLIGNAKPQSQEKLFDMIGWLDPLGTREL